MITMNVNFEHFFFFTTLLITTVQIRQQKVVFDSKPNYSRSPGVTSSSV
jgi:hypothetical protein